MVLYVLKLFMFFLSVFHVGFLRDKARRPNEELGYETYKESMCLLFCKDSFWFILFCGVFAGRFAEMSSFSWNMVSLLKHLLTVHRGCWFLGFIDTGSLFSFNTMYFFQLYRGCVAVGFSESSWSILWGFSFTIHFHFNSPVLNKVVSSFIILPRIPHSLSSMVIGCFVVKPLGRQSCDDSNRKAFFVQQINRRIQLDGVQ